MKRFVVREAGRDPLPAIDLGDDVVVIGSGAEARVRLPAPSAREVHVRIEGDRWVAIGEVSVDGVRKRPGAAGVIGGGIEFGIADIRVTAAPAPADVKPSSPQRTESLARELVRGLLGAGAAPVLELERGPGGGARRELPPPEATLVIGRGDEAGWVILDEDLSREHAEVKRGWDGVVIRDLDSKNGTVVDGERIDGTVDLHDGARIELGNVALVFRDPAERHMRGDVAGVVAIEPKPRVSAPRLPVQQPAPSLLPFLIAAAIAGIAAVALAWILMS